jgi:uncharacterized protein YjbI with pentapeptide repeats
MAVGADFTGAPLERSSLRGANLGHANFEEANLEGANLMEATLRRSHVIGSRIERANDVIGSCINSDAFRFRYEASEYVTQRCHTL